MRQSFFIGQRQIGQGCSPLFLPDIGTFFNQDTEDAKLLIAQLADTGVEAIKGEILHTAEIALDVDYHTQYFGQEEGVVQERYRDLIARKVVSLDNYAAIFSLCKEYQLPFILSVYDFKGADFAREIGAASLKIASSNITHQPLMEHIAHLELPVILDTGKATFSEISRAVDWLKSAGVDRLIIEHSPKAPPAPVSEQNLLFMKTMAQAFKVPVGLSDHHAGNEMLLAATTLGAAVLEKGLCQDDKALDQDVAHAMRFSQVEPALRQIQMIHQALGDGERNPAGIIPHQARMGLIAARDLAKGEEISMGDLSYAFPALGIKVEYTQEIVGSHLINHKRAGEVINWQDIVKT
ncbi:MAG: N-acetylneuraminate synthase family protein [Desulfonatronovibrio sp.]